MVGIRGRVWKHRLYVLWFSLDSFSSSIWSFLFLYLGFPGGSDSNMPAMREIWFLSLCWEDPLEEDMATHSSILAWRIPMDRGAWWATVHRVAKSQTRLKQLSRHGWLQCCVSSTCTAKWLNYTYTYIHSFPDFFPMMVITEYWVEFPVLYNRSLLSLLYIVVCICQSQTPNLSCPSPLSPLVIINLFSESVSLFLFCK